jgi:hypothetical protein
MTDGQSEWMRVDRPIPDERDQIEAPRCPDLRCREHDGLCEVAHSLHNRLVELEGRVDKLERGEK